jgi:DNA repair exonuclease SbcCD ATPase subunit
MARTVADLDRDLAQARSTYGGRFAGQPRATRPMTRLDELIATVRAVAGEAERMGAAASAAEARRLEAAWTEERAAILEAQRGGRDAVRASDLAQWLRDSFQRYRRFFAGQARDTRDVGILQEIIEDVERRVGEIDALLLRYTDADLAAAREQATTNLGVYRSELGEIRAARASGVPDQRAARLAGLANAQFQRYRDLFAGKERVSRRRRTLELIVATLTEILDEMLEVERLGTTLPNHARNVQIVRSNLQAYEAEIQNLRVARSRATRGDRVRGLAEAANAVFDQYRAEFGGHARATRDPARVAAMWELLWPLALEMEDLARDDDAEPVGSNLRKVRDNLRLYEREWVLVHEARGRPPA